MILELLGTAIIGMLVYVYLRCVSLFLFITLLRTNRSPAALVENATDALGALFCSVCVVNWAPPGRQQKRLGTWHGIFDWRFPEK